VLKKSVTSVNNIVECGYGFWFRFSLINPKKIYAYKTGDIYDLGGLYFSYTAGVY
jgi:hypothetical protein